MSITIVEGADFVGKTTLCMKMFANPNSIYVHFPIREDVMFHLSNQSKYEDRFTKCKLSGSMEEIQDIIFDNIVANSEPIMYFFNKGFDVIVDRFMLSNEVYRKLHGVAPRKSENEFYLQVLGNSKSIILTESDKVLAERCSSAIKCGDELDRINEQIDNVLRANQLYKSI